jgi:hypothetical protein
VAKNIQPLACGQSDGIAQPPAGKKAQALLAHSKRRMPDRSLEALDKVSFLGGGGFRSIETAGRNLRRQWNAALHPPMPRGKNTEFLTL